VPRFEGGASGIRGRNANDFDSTLGYTHTRTHTHGGVVVVGRNYSEVSTKSGTDVMLIHGGQEGTLSEEHL
jgi:hypothetical protein